MNLEQIVLQYGLILDWLFCFMTKALFNFSIFGLTENLFWHVKLPMQSVAIFKELLQRISHLMP